MSETTPTTSSISLVLPAFNEGESICQAIREADAALAAVCDDYEILVVDDGSTDDTPALVAREAAERSRVRVLTHTGNRGYGAALRTGFAAASKELVGFTDADCQFDLRQLDRLALLCRSHDVACGYRLDRQDTFQRRMLARAYNLLVTVLFHVGVRDCDCALKLFRRRLLQEIPITTNGFFVNAELLARLRSEGASVVEVGVTHRPRLAGSSKVSPWQILPVLRDMLRFWWSWVEFPQAEPVREASADRPATVRTAVTTALLVALALPLLFTGLHYPLIAPDETRYARIPSEMLASGDFVVPTLDGQPYLDKPPLLYWLTAAVYRTFGESEHTARLPTALAGLLTTLLVYVLGRRLVGERAAALAALLQLTTVGFVLGGRFLTMDGLLTLFTTACLLAAYLGAAGSRFRPGWWVAAGVACGLGFMTKGPIVLVLCLPPLLASRWLTRSPVRLNVRRWLAFLTPMAVVTVPWFIAISRRHPGFLAYFFWRHNVVRFVDAFDHQHPWWFYLPVGAIALLPCTALLPALAVFLTSRSGELRRLRTHGTGYLALAAGWVVVFFSLSSSKLPSYVFPAMPPTALLLGQVLAGGLLAPVEHPYLRRAARRLPRWIAFGGLLAVGLLAALDMALDATPRFAGHAAAWTVIALATVGLVVVGRGWPAPGRRAWAAAAAVSWTAIAILYFALLPEVARLRDLPAKAISLAAQMGEPGMTIASVGSRTGPGFFYMRRRDNIEDFTPEQLDRLEMLSNFYPRMLVISDPRSATKVRDQLSPRKLVETEPGSFIFVVGNGGTGAGGGERAGGGR